MMMFADIIKYVEEKEYQLAVDALTPLLKNEDEKIVAKAHHILGYINTRHDYTEKSDYQAKRHLRFIKISKQFLDLTLCNSANGGKACIYGLFRHLLYGRTIRI